MLTGKIQEESLRTYLFTYSHVYDSMSLITLAEMFELEKANVHGIISKMIINEELMASLDEPSQSLVMHKTEPSRLQSLALQVADKVGLLVEYNERILESKTGVSRSLLYEFDEQPGMFAEGVKITHSLVLEKFIEIVDSFHGRRTDRLENIALLTQLRAISESKKLGPALKAKIDFAMISALSDYDAAVTSSMTAENWEKVMKKVRKILNDLSSCEDFTVAEHVLKENESFEKPPYKIQGCIMKVCERMDDEFNKLLKDCDAHGPEYVKRLKDEKSVCDIFEHLQRYMESRESTPSDLCRVYLRRVEHLYYKIDPTVFTERDPVSRLFVFPSLGKWSAVLSKRKSRSRGKCHSTCTSISSYSSAFIGPPESMREHVVAAARAMRNGKWKQCRDFIINEKMNAKVWDLFYQADRVREMITGNIQEESLRTYLCTYSHVYDSMSLITLAEMFELEKANVHGIISKMIINEELMASLDEPNQSLVMLKTEPSRLQSLALQVADKVRLLVEYNERILESKTGIFNQRNQQNYRQQFGGQRGQDGGRGGWNRRGGRDRRDRGGGDGVDLMETVFGALQGENCRGKGGRKRDNRCGRGGHG
ncbi:unnamed protein product, partial [Notodromas monacha]